MSEFALTLWIETGEDNTQAELYDRSNDRLRGRNGEKVVEDIFNMTEMRLIDWQVVEVEKE